MKVRMRFIAKLEDHAVYVRRDPNPKDQLDERYVLKIPLSDTKDLDNEFINVTIEAEKEHPDEKAGRLKALETLKNATIDIDGKEA